MTNDSSNNPEVPGDADVIETVKSMLSESPAGMIGYHALARKFGYERIDQVIRVLQENHVLIECSRMFARWSQELEQEVFDEGAWDEYLRLEYLDECKDWLRQSIKERPSVEPMPDGSDGWFS